MADKAVGIAYALSKPGLQTINLAKELSFQVSYLL